jgi:hypothetical protein
MKLRIACALAVLALALPSVSMAQGATSTLNGTVVSSSDTSLVVKPDTGAERTFVVDTSSRLPSGLNAGTRVSVSYHIMDGGTLHADSVTLGDSPSAARTTPATDDTMGTRAQTDPMAADERPLPATASNESLLLMTGLLALAGGLALRRTLSHN